MSTNRNYLKPLCEVCGHINHHNDHICPSYGCFCVVSDGTHKWLRDISVMSKTLETGIYDHEYLNCKECIKMFNLYVQFQKDKIKQIQDPLQRRKRYRLFNSTVKYRRTLLYKR